MSVDEFDPVMERLFSRAPDLGDSSNFNAAVTRRLNASTRFRTGVLTVAGLAGGVFAASEMIGFNLRVGGSSVVAESADRADPLMMVARDGGVAAQSVLDSLGLSGFDYGSMAQMQMFWVAAGLVLALLSVGAVKLYQQV